MVYDPGAHVFSGAIDSEENKEIEDKLRDTISELNSNKAAVLNLLEDIEAEKQGVELEVKKRTEELRSEQAVLRSTIDSLPIAFFLISSDFILIQNNGLLNQVFSVDRVNNFTEMDRALGPDFSLRGQCEEVIDESRQKVFNDIRIGDRFVKIYLQPVSSIETKEKIGLLGLIEDVTEQKILERSKDEFFSIASHELRTPLTAIMGNTSMILDFFSSQLPNDDVKQMVEDIHEASTRLLKIVSDFLDTSRLEQGKVIFKMEKLDLNEVIEDTYREFETAAILKGLKMDKSVVEGGLFVSADRDKVKQIISNLISNALNYTLKGEIHIYTKKDSAGNASFYIKDSGVGISKENQKLLFRKFQQAQEKLLTRDVTRSTGLGLYISKLLADAMRAKVELVESEIGRGSTFRLVLPMAI